MYFDLSTLDNGTTQDERRIATLMPDFIEVDERDISSLLKFITELSAQFNYYDAGNNLQGDWQDFFLSDIHVLRVMVSGYDLAEQLNKFLQLEDALYLAETNPELTAGLKKLFDFVMGVLDLMHELHRRLENLAGSSPVVGDMLKVVDNFDDELACLEEYNREAVAQFGGDLEMYVRSGLKKKRRGTKEITQIFSHGITVREKILNALPGIKDVFSGLSTKFSHLQGITQFYLDNTTLLEEHFPPHLALYLAFLHLYRHLQGKINSITKDHLDLYYKRILGIGMKGAERDRAHLVFEKDPALPNVQLNAGEELLAQVPGQQEPAAFTLDDAILVTDVQIAELKTLCLAPGSTQELLIYKGNYPCPTAAAALKNKAPVKTWPVLGEPQDGLPAGAKTMQLADIGLMLASPVLYLPDGQRTISIYIDIDDDAFDGFVSELSGDSAKDPTIVSHQLLSDAFLIDYTDTAGWKKVRKYNAALNMAQQRLEIDMQVNNADQVFDLYKPEVHGGTFDIQWPVVRILLNNDAANYPFILLRSIKMDRVTIRAAVTGSKKIRLQNSIGPLSPVTLSQPFGPIPAIGSYLEVASSNIFNKYTRSFCLKIDWADLPRDPGGWATYYRAYNNNINNNSFKVKLSAAGNGKFVPDEQARQEFALFETGEDATLRNTTALRNIDVKRLEFSDSPLLNLDEAAAAKNVAAGTVRIELTAPNDAFGHRLFPQIFPQIVLHNARRSKKLELPNQPYIPSMHGLSVDYVLEHSESLATGNVQDKADIDLKVFHLYPFGYEKIYPAEKGAPYSFIPDFDQENNLFIGLKGVSPGQELSLLFQVRENNYDELPETADVSWSYLDGNQWVYLSEKDVLRDDTHNFINKGIVRLKLPRFLKTGNTILSPQLYWIRASAKRLNAVRSNITGIYAQAATVTRAPAEPIRALILPAGSIQMFRRKIAGISTVTQPFASFGGSFAESDEQYYIRVSERLRHGQKLLTRKDIEQAILDRFPGILMAKCISPQEYAGPLIGKSTKVILIPKEKANGLFLSDEPKVDLSVRYDVKMFLETVVQSFLKIEIENPVYERIKVICEVKFRNDSGTDTGMLAGKLAADIKRYLCPWLYVEGSDFKIGSGIYMSEMLNFIKKQPYIKQVKNFSLVHFFSDTDDMNDEKKARVIEYIQDNDVYIKGATPESVLIPSKSHLISIQDDGKEPITGGVGISEFEITDELLVSRKSDTRPPKVPAVPGNNRSAEKKQIFNLVISRP
ncbi:MAG: hypothetical protein JSU01_09385 [Bacteroidetes bacterium]|nr:hypothetical protein [Bacteroidota bacterium]